MMKWETETFQSVDKTEHLSESLKNKLKALHIDTVEDFIAISRIDSLQELLLSNLTIEKKDFTSMVQTMTKAYDLEETDIFSALTPETMKGMPFNCKKPTEAMIQELGLLQEEQTDAEYMLTPLEVDRVNHIPSLFPIRSQGERGTCVAFGSVAMREFLEQSKVALSEQYLYWGAKMRDGDTTSEGTWIHYAMQCLEEEGVCSAEEWPYNPIPGATYENLPPKRAVDRAGKFRISRGIAINPRSVNDLRSIISGKGGDRGRLISFAVPVFRSWHENPITYKTGRLVMPLPGELQQGGHCMCMVGFKDDPEWPGGGFFILRNSWGEKWGAECPYGSGYGTIPYKFISLYCWEAWTAEVQGRQVDRVHRPIERKKLNESKIERGKQKKRNFLRLKDEKIKRKSHAKMWKALASALAVLLVLGVYGFHDQFSQHLEISCEKLIFGTKGAYQRYKEKANDSFYRGRYRKAEEFYSNLLIIKPDYADAFAMMAKCEYATGNLKGALEFIDKAIAQSDQAAELHYEYGILLIESGQKGKALYEWNRAIELDPNLVSAKYLLRRYNTRE